MQALGYNAQLGIKKTMRHRTLKSQEPPIFCDRQECSQIHILEGCGLMVLVFGMQEILC